MKKLVLFRGVIVDASLIRNPKLRRVFQDRRGDFMFNHSENTKYDDGHTEHKEKYGDTYEEHKERYNEVHTDHTDRHTDEYNYSYFYDLDIHSESHTDFT